MPRSSASPARAVRLAVVGAGPRAVGFLERLAASLPELAPDAPLEIDLIDPYAPGAGRIWRYAQSPLLKLNSMAQDVTMFTDSSSTIEGPVRNGPSLIEWAVAVRGGLLPEVTVHDPRLRAELEHLLPTSFPTRRLQSLYLDWFHRRAVAALESVARLRVHRATVLAVGDESEVQRVLLDTGETIDADVVLYAIGHTGRDPEAEHDRLIDFARRRELYYLPPAFTADADTRPIVPGQRVIVRGFGLAAIDLIVLLTEGRGGRFERDGGGRLRYLAAGREPRLVIGSRRGVPYHSKIASTLRAPRPAPRFFTPEIARALVRERAVLDFRDDVWPLIAKEMLWGHYAELFLGHPERVSTRWESFRIILEREAWDSPILRTAIEHGVLDPLDRLHLTEFDRPLAGRRFADAAALQDAVRGYIRTDLIQRTAPEHSASLGQFLALLGSLFTLLEILDAPVWSDRSRLYDLPRTWPNYFSFVASGPPAHRLEEILALAEAGLIEFAGGGLEVEADEVNGVFVARGENSPHTWTASALVDARLPDSAAAFSDNAALRSLIESGVGAEDRIRGALLSGSTGRLLVDQRDTRILRPDGSAHPQRYAIGPYTSSPFAGAFSRPGTNAIAFRENDSTARAILRRLSEIARERRLENHRTLIGTRTP
ncbi:FAD/NAD(P)-binding protein [Microbacteriaceae bacterium VKM Ac-2854]|nr:FAD/NAD(P)-binding protein [Microbacteriaceae bacterium VKM Ac-2854]